jgi:hypothetical protein
VEAEKGRKSRLMKFGIAEAIRRRAMVARRVLGDREGRLAIVQLLDCKVFRYRGGDTGYVIEVRGGGENSMRRLYKSDGSRSRHAMEGLIFKDPDKSEASAATVIPHQSLFQIAVGSALQVELIVSSR